MGKRSGSFQDERAVTAAQDAKITMYDARAVQVHKEANSWQEFPRTSPECFGSTFVIMAGF